MKYLIPFDFSQVSVNAVKQSINFAEVSGGEISILHIVNDKELLRKREVQLKSFISELKFPKNIHIRGNVVIGDVLQDVGKIAKYHGADLVFMGTHGVDALQKVFGSNSIKMIRNSSVPFLVFQEHFVFQKIKKIVMPFSIETRSMQVLRFASQISKMYGAEIHLVGRIQSDEFLIHKENSNVILAKSFLTEAKVNHRFEFLESSKAGFQNSLLNYAEGVRADLIATTYFSDTFLPMFEKFVQNLLVNDKYIPVLCVNAQTLLKVDSTLSFMTV